MPFKATSVIVWRLLLVSFLPVAAINASTSNSTCCVIPSSINLPIAAYSSNAKDCTGHLASRQAEHFFRRRIHLRHSEMLIDLDDRVHRAADQRPNAVRARAAVPRRAAGVTRLRLAQRRFETALEFAARGARGRMSRPAR